MHWDETSLFIHSNLAETSPRGRSTPNPRYVHKRETSTRDTRICYRSSTSHLEVYVSVEVPTKGGPLHLGHFPPSSDYKDQARVTYSNSGWYKLPWAATTFGCSKAMPSRLGAQSSKSNKHELCQPSEERGALEMGNQLTSTLQSLALNPS
jgi:hypothetical protein